MSFVQQKFRNRV